MEDVGVIPLKEALFEQAKLKDPIRFQQNFQYFK